jgi:tight adherence protein B
MDLSPTTILIIGGGFAFLLLIIGLVVSLTSERSMVEERLGKYVETKQAEEEAKRLRDSSALTAWVNKRVEKSSYGDRISRELSRADLRLKSGEYVLLNILSVLFVAAVGYVIGRQSIILALAGGALGFFLPRMYVRSQQGKRLNKFNDQLPDMLNLMVNGLRAGYSTMQAMEAISKELPSPISDEFRRVVQEMQLGVPMETALDNLLRRIPSDDLDFVVTAINVQREVGGNLSEILDSISYTIRERVRIKGEIRVMTAQVRASGTLLSIIPMGLALILWFMNPDYLLSFFEGPSPLCGWAAIGLIIIMIATGYFVMMKIADIEV